MAAGDGLRVGGSCVSAIATSAQIRSVSCFSLQSKEPPLTRWLSGGKSAGIQQSMSKYYNKSNKKTSGAYNKCACGKFTDAFGWHDGPCRTATKPAAPVAHTRRRNNGGAHSGRGAAQFVAHGTQDETPTTPTTPALQLGTGVDYTWWVFPDFIGEPFCAPAHFMPIPPENIIATVLTGPHYLTPTFTALPVLLQLIS